MSASMSPEPDRSGEVIYVGRDRAGRWLVQDGAGLLEGHFISLKAAMSYAEGERRAHHARLELASAPLRSFLSPPMVDAAVQGRAA